MPSLNPDAAATGTTAAVAHANGGSPKRDLASLLAAARPFLRDEADTVPSDPALSSLLSALRAAGAGECFHKHGTFLAHLSGVHRILTLWGAPLSVARCGLYHSAYSNSYVNLAIFKPDATSRAALSLSLGPSAERLVHLFCIVPRQEIIHDFLLFRYSDAELTDHLNASADPSHRGIDEPWRQKINSLVPRQGIYVKHIRTGEDVLVSRRVIAVFLLMTMADFSDQLFGYQDRLLNNENGRYEFTGNNPGALWPGDARPGLWMNSISRMGAIYNLLVKEEEIYMEEKRRELGRIEEEDEDIYLVIPPVFESCTRVLDTDDQKTARDLYWEAVAADGGGEVGEKPEKLLSKSCEKNPFVGEPHVVLAQVYLGMERWEEAEREAEIGLRLMLEWGTGWDKRVTWEGWIAWARVLLMKAKEKDWPKSAWGILNLGLVR